MAMDSEQTNHELQSGDKGQEICQGNFITLSLPVISRMIMMISIFDL